VARLTAAFDVATLCSQSEAFPNVIGEAMACCVPCVATDVGECRRVIGDTGRIVETQDPGALAAAWTDLLALPASERRTLGFAARQRVVRDFDITSIAKQYQSLYESLVEPDSSYEPQPCTTQPILKH
jgi:glycosyltransferase involved in cell wall biosynthesis